MILRKGSQRAAFDSNVRAKSRWLVLDSQRAPQRATSSGSSVCQHPSASIAARRARGAVVAYSSSNDSSSSSSSSGSQVSVAVSSPPASTPAAAAAGGKDAILARIAQAKAYKQGAAAGSSSSTTSSSTESGNSGSSSSTSDPGSLTAEEQELLRQQYIEQLRQQQQQLAADSSSYSAFIQNTTAQQEESRSSQGSNSGPSGFEELEAADAGGGQRKAPAREDFYTNNVPSVTDLVNSAPKRAGAGSVDEAADFLKGVLGATTDPTLAAMRPEEVTLAKEAAARQRGAEIITAFPEDFGASTPAAAAAGSSDVAAAAAGAAAAQEDGEKYKPKVTTWGVFPRPSNISEAYGGGRNIRPGQALETPEQKQKREAEYAAALSMYKKATYTDSLSESELAAAQAQFNSGMKLFNRGDIANALVVFDEVREKVPLKSKLGGLSTLQAAVCYDTLGQGRKAEALYKRIRGHPTSEVSRKAKQLVFGFQAMSFLKTEGLSYAVKKEDYLKYFRRAADRNRYYVASDEEKAADQAEAARAAAVALGVVLGPVVILGALVAAH